MDRSVAIWCIDSLRVLKVLPGHTRAVAWSPCSRFVVTADSKSNIKIWDVKAAKVLNSLKEGSSQLMSIDFSPCGKKIISAGRDGTVILLSF